MSQEKIKIKLSELTDMYDIENDSEEKTSEEKTVDDLRNNFEITMKDGDDKLEKEVDEEHASN